jgi:type I restriction enzyme, S subunit
MNDGWVNTTLGELVEFIVGRTPPRNDASYWTDDLTRPFCTIADMDGVEILPSREGVTAKAEFEGKARRVPAGSLLLSYKLTIGRVGFAACDLFPNEAIAWLRPKTLDIDLRFLALFLSRRDLEGYAARAVKGKTLNRKALKAIPVQLPPLAQQHRVADLIEAVVAVRYAAIGEAKRGDAMLAALRRALVDESDAARRPLGDEVGIEAPLVDPRLPENRDLPHIGVEKIQSGTGELAQLRTASGDGVTSGKFRFTSDDVIYSKIRPNRRKVTIPGFTGLSSADAYPLRPRQGLDMRYLLHVILSDQFTGAAVAKSGRTKMPKINRKELFSISIPVPAPDEQVKIAELLEAVRATVSAATETATTAHRLHTALLGDLLSGEHEIPESYDALLESA